jgi:hypothetical protein
MVKKKKQAKKKAKRAYWQASKKVVKTIAREKKTGTSGTGPRLCGDDNEA